MLKSIRRKLHLDNYKLETVAKACNIEISNLHRALADCELIYRINNKLNIFWNNVSINTHYFMIFLVYSPHTRGWTWLPIYKHIIVIIFPAYAGVNPYQKNVWKRGKHIPRIRGGEPFTSSNQNNIFPYSPHTRGWTWIEKVVPPSLLIFPAYAGVNLNSFNIIPWRSNIPRIRGGEPKIKARKHAKGGYSPHTRGWTWNYI